MIADRQTDRHAHRNTPLSSQGRSKNMTQDKTGRVRLPYSSATVRQTTKQFRRNRRQITWAADCLTDYVQYSDRRTRKVLVITTRRCSQHATPQRSVKYNCQQLHIIILTTMDGKRTDYWMMLSDTVDMVYYRIKQFRQKFNENQFSSTQIYLVRFK